MTGLARAVRTVVHQCLAVAPGEDVVVVVDAPLADVGEALRDEAERAQADAVLAVMAPRENHGTEPPRPIAEALAACDVFIAPTSRSMSHTQARKRATDGGARGATMPTVTADMLARLMDVDFEVLRARSRAVGRAARRRGRGARHLPARHRPEPGPRRPPRHRRRRRPDRPRRFRQPAVRRGLHRAGRGRGDDRHAVDRLARPRAGPPRAPDRRGRAHHPRHRARGRAPARAPHRRRRARAPTSPSSASAPTTARA